MKKKILPILLMFVLWGPRMICAEDAMRGVVILPTASDVVSQESSGLSGLSDGKKRAYIIVEEKAFFWT